MKVHTLPGSVERTEHSKCEVCTMLNKTEPQQGEESLIRLYH